MQLVSSRFKGTKGDISPRNLKLSCESPYYMAFRILTFYTSVCSRRQLSTLQEKTFKGNKYQGITSGSKAPKDTHHWREVEYSVLAPFFCSSLCIW